MHCFEIDAIEDLKSVAKEIKKEIDCGTRIVLLTGNLGAGKTTLVQQLAHELGIADQVTSPTFSIINEYSFSDNEQKMYHIDLYRLKSEHEIESIGLSELLNSDELVLIEWPEKARDMIFGKRIEVDIQINEEKRKVCVNKIDSEAF